MCSYLRAHINIFDLLTSQFSYLSMITLEPLHGYRKYGAPLGQEPDRGAPQAMKTECGDSLVYGLIVPPLLDRSRKNIESK